MPAYVDRHTLAFAVSMTGETEEVLRTAADAAARGAHLVAIGAGGDESSLARLAADRGSNAGAVWRPLGAPGTPRAGLGGGRR